MKPASPFLASAVLGFTALLPLPPCAHGAETGAQAEVLEIEREVQFSRPQSQWTPAREGLRLAVADRLRTLALSRATVQLAELGKLRLKELTTLEILPPRTASSKATLDLRNGALYFLTRGKPGEFLLQSPHVVGASRGTEFLALVESNQTVVAVFDGEVALSNPAGSLVLTNGEQALVLPGQAPVRTAAIQTTNIVQWWLYYPGVLDPDELSLSPAEHTALVGSLAAYRNGDLLRALDNYPPGRAPQSESERIYYAGLLLSVGQLDKAEPLLAGIATNSAPRRLAAALRQVIAVVTQGRAPSPSSPPSSILLATEWLALSYAQQPTNLTAALESARLAVKQSPAFGFGWERVAELEFSSGRLAATEEALTKALALAPRNAQALALRGFVLAGEGRIGPALRSFQEAIDIDGSLGNAWLGRGLCRIRQGDAQGGRNDLQTAAVLEPNRALLHSYLGKAFGNLYDEAKAQKELALAQRLDPKDPTSWLYAGLLHQQENQINQAIADLEASEQRNDNRSLFRSRLLLDEDRAVRSANLASIYRDAGMSEVSVREAARAVTYDYANDSAHLFLSDSYNELRDPTRFNLRYETVWFNELLLANILSPVGGGRLSPQLSQQEYSRLFEAEGLHLANATDVRTDRQFSEQASQFGTFGSTSYSLDLGYQHNHGSRINNELEIWNWAISLKEQITPEDTALLLFQFENYHSGDNFQYYYQTNARPHFKFEEYQNPIAVGAWHHEWSPGMHTLFLGGRLENEQFFSDKGAGQIALRPVSFFVVPFDAAYHSQLEAGTAELNQIVEWRWLTLSAGARYQSGTFDTTARLFNPDLSGDPSLIPVSPFREAATNAISTREPLERITGYGYLTVQPADQLRLIGGLAYDDLTYPRNFRSPPLSSGTAHSSQLGPKAALVWSPIPQATLRGVFTRSLGGVSLDESYRLEPTQLAGFPQAFRSLISESEVGSVAAPKYQTFGLALDLKFPTGTYAGVQAERLETRINRAIGVFAPTITNFFGVPLTIPPWLPSTTPESLDYYENSLRASVDQLLGREFVLGASYKFTQAHLHDSLPDVHNFPSTSLDLVKRSELHQATAYLVFNHASGFFARVETQWYHQANSVDRGTGPGDDFFQHNLFAGYRFAHRHAQLTLGLLNLAGRDYHLSPLTVYSELPRKRVLEANLVFEF